MRGAIFILVSAVLLLAGCRSVSELPAAEHFSINRLFGSHMVIQRSAPLVVFGTGSPLRRLQASLSDGKNPAVTKNIAIDNQGAWSVDFGKLPHRGPWQLTIDNTVEDTPVKAVLEDILCGEVWLAFGQSNMEFPLTAVYDAAQQLSELSKYPNVRIFRQSRKTSPLTELTEPDGEWQIPNRDNLKKFSAIGYLFAAKISSRYGVPVGVIDASWGGSRLEPWISEKAYHKANRAKVLDKLADLKYQHDGHVYTMDDFYRWEKKLHSDYAAEQRAAESWPSPDFDDQNWLPCWMPGTVEQSGISMDGVFWVRKTIDLPLNFCGGDLELYLSIIDDCDETYFNGVKVGETTVATKDYWNVPRRYKIPEHLVKPGRNVIAVRIIDHAGTGGFTQKNAQLFLSSAKGKLTLNGKWKLAVESKHDPLRTQPRPWPSDFNSFGNPTTLYNAMIAPWTRVKVRGLLFYQGCANIYEAPEYAIDFPLLVSSYRSAWRDSRLPFIFAQISGLDNALIPASERSDLAQPWSELQIAQYSVLDLPQVAMVVTTDVGDANDIHPTNKTTVADRFVLAAEKLFYDPPRGVTGLQQPTVGLDGNRAKVSWRDLKPTQKLAAMTKFDRKGLPLLSPILSGIVRGFELAGADKVFYPADGRIDGNEVLLYAPEVANIEEVRYAYDCYPYQANLYLIDGMSTMLPIPKFNTASPLDKQTVKYQIERR